MSSNIELRALSFLSAFPSDSFDQSVIDRPWPQRHDLAMALDYIEELVKELNSLKSSPAASIAVAIKTARERLGLSLADAAKMAGITKSHLWEMEQGNAVNPTLEAMRGLSRALELRPVDWFGVAPTTEDVR